MAQTKNNSAQASLFEIWDSPDPVQVQSPAVKSGVSTAEPLVEAPNRLPEPSSIVANRAPVTSISGRGSKNKKTPPITADAPSDLEAGDELVYNRRNRIVKGLSWADIENLNPALRVKSVTKQKVWPRPDYEKLIESGVPAIVAYQFKYVYDNVASKPAVSGAPTDEQLRRYVELVAGFQAKAEEWLSTRSDWISMLANSYAGAAGVANLLDVDLKGAIPVSIKDRIFPGGKESLTREMGIAGGVSVYNATIPDYSELKKFVKDIKSGWPSKKESWEIQGYQISDGLAVTHGAARYVDGKYEVAIAGRVAKTYDTPTEAAVHAASLKSFMLFDKRGNLVDSFATHEEALDGARKAAGRAKKTVVDEKGAKVENVKRVGPERRQGGADINSRMLLEEFGLRGVNFGNWLKTGSARQEAQLHQNHAYDAFHDLAELLNVPPKAVGLNGMLGLAFGAQGSGGTAAAHFVPGVNEINITRENGASFVGHEWWHGLDHYFAVVAGLERTDTPFLSEHVKDLVPDKRDLGDLRPEIAHAFLKLVNAMTKRVQTTEEAEADLQANRTNAKKRLDSWVNSFRNDYNRSYDKNVVLDPEVEKLLGRLYVGDFGGSKVAVGKSYLTPVVVELRAKYKEKRGSLYSLEDAERIQRCADWYQLALEDKASPRVVDSNYLTAARKLDREKGGKPYWSTLTELGARAADAYLADRLIEMGRESGYLCSARRGAETVPHEEERASINACFGELVRVLKANVLDDKATLYSFAKPAAGNSLSAGEVTATVMKIRSKWPGMPELTVLETESDADFPIEYGAQGLYRDGRVWLVARNIASTEDLERVMVHECVFHMGLHQMLSDSAFDSVVSGIQALKVSGNPTVVSLAQAVHRSHGVLNSRDEAAEIIAKAGERCLDQNGNVSIKFGFMKAAYSKVAEWLRDKGFEVQFSTTELQGLLHRAVERTKRVAETSESLNLADVSPSNDDAIPERSRRSKFRPS